MRNIQEIAQILDRIDENDIVSFELETDMFIFFPRKCCNWGEKIYLVRPKTEQIFDGVLYHVMDEIGLIPNKYIQSDIVVTNINNNFDVNVPHAKFTVLCGGETFGNGIVIDEVAIFHQFLPKEFTIKKSYEFCVEKLNDKEGTELKQHFHFAFTANTSEEKIKEIVKKERNKWARNQIVISSRNI